ncbi:MAG: hypothetical protein FVQ82_05165 [Planctomycetes bacterium]|nr:hypothetical protein [Planctomycetota bacterium]
MSRQKNKVSNLADQQKPPSFKLSGLIILCVLGFLLFGFNPQASTGSTSCDAPPKTDTIGKAIQHITSAITSLL